MTLPVRLGEARAGRVAAPLLRLAAARIGDQQEFVVRQELVLQRGLLHLVVVLLKECNEALRDGLARGVRLRHLTTTMYRHVDAQPRVVLGSHHSDGLHDLRAQRIGQDLLQRHTVHLDVALGSLRDRGHGDCRLLLAEGLHLLQRVALVSGHDRP
ncbi:40S ribosomal protein S16, putative [Leishmania tarentolae]|uniref:40S ribosomal protein S16, putative n=1 Tax=Leishmania tarentolae TaxID=5689 RepID=A0A640KI91_LEITA|nr:40S ribosomal protein S16, putative [Leishmania tarentolae]